MSLLTPPSTGKRHHAKEGEALAGSSRGVTWVFKPTFHYFEATSTVPKTTRPVPPSPRPILKRESSYPLLPFEDEDSKREDTPEPEDPLINLNYIERPVQTILESDDLKALVEAYNVLSARLRSSVITEQGECDADSSWPLFQPIRKNTDAFVASLERDIARAKQNPLETAPKEEESERFFLDDDDDESMCQLPSPKSSPLKPANARTKKCGMTASQVIHARDVCNLAHASMRLLNTIFTYRAVYSLLPDSAITSLITSLLAIPMSSKLPTPNARKTYALAVNTLSSLAYLPPSLLTPSVTGRLAFSLQRAIDGELGKEGKKGACSDGLRAIASLTLTYPSTFVEAFEPLLPSILADLLHVTLNIRSIAAHALSAYALASTRISSADIHRRFASTIVEHLAPTTSSKLGSPVKESPLVRAIRTALSGVQTETGSLANTPHWGLTILPSLITLMSTAMYIPTSSSAVIKVRNTLKNFLNQPLMHKKLTVRMTGSAVLGTTAWIALQPPAFRSLDEDADMLTKEQEEALFAARKAFWKVPMSHLDHHGGVNLIAALTWHPLARSPQASQTPKFLAKVQPQITLALQVLATMVRRKGPEKIEAVLCLMKLLDLPLPASQSKRTSNDDEPFRPRNALLPDRLFAGQDEGGLLSPEAASSQSVVKGIIRSMGQVSDITPLPAAFLRVGQVQDALNGIWLEAVKGLSLPHQSQSVVDVDPELVKSIWCAMLKSRMAATSKDEVRAFIHAQAEFLIKRVLCDPSIEVVPEVSPSTSSQKNRLQQFACESYVSPVSEDSIMDDVMDRNANTKLNLIKDIWSLTRKLVTDSTVDGSASLLDRSGTLLLDHLMQKCDAYADSTLWAQFCAEILVDLVVSSSDGLERVHRFWGYDGCPEWFSSIMAQWSQSTYCEVWATVARRWEEEMDAHCSVPDETLEDVTKPLWHGACLILCAPFIGRGRGLEGYDREWSSFMEVTLKTAQLEGVESPAVLSHMARICMDQGSSSVMATTKFQLMDRLLTEAGPAISSKHTTSDTIGDFLDFIGQSFKQAYPPSPEHRHQYIVLIHSITTIADRCPTRVCSHMIQSLGESIGIWTGDEEMTLDGDDWEEHILFLFRITLLSLGSTASPDTIRLALPMLQLAFSGREDKRVFVQDAFCAAWEDTIAKTGLDVHQLDIPVLYQWLGIEESTQDEEEMVVDEIPARPCTPPPRSVTPTPSAHLPYQSPFAAILSSPVRAPPSPLKTPRSGRGTPSNKRRRFIESDEQEKENVPELSPLFTPISQRIATLKRSPKGMDDDEDQKWSSKRQFDDDAFVTGASRVKRARVERGSPSEKSDSDEDAQIVAGNLLSASENSASDTTSNQMATARPKKRKLLDSLEMPSMRQTYTLNLTKSLDSSGYVYKTPPRIGKPRKRKVKSLDTRVSKKRPYDADVEFEELFGRPKQQSRTCDDCGHLQLSEVDCEPEIGSDDSFDLFESPVKADPPSSDDDPFYGQVTPHHVTSPEMRGKNPFALLSQPSSPERGDIEDLFSEEEYSPTHVILRNSKKTSRKSATKRKTSRTAMEVFN